MTKAFVESKPKSCLVHNFSIVTIQKRKKKKRNNLSIMINGTRIVVGIMKGKPMSGRNKHNFQRGWFLGFPGNTGTFYETTAMFYIFLRYTGSKRTQRTPNVSTGIVPNVIPIKVGPSFRLITHPHVVHKVQS